MIRHGARLLMAGAIVLGGMAILATEASAQATRTWISGVGDDANPCSRTAPCRTFAGTISKTAAGGEINCLDSGGAGAVTITKSITILCDSVIGGVLVAGTNGITINDGGAGTVNVVLSGLDIDGLGYSPTSSGIRGVWFVSGASLTVRNSTIRNFRDAANGAGIAFTPSTAAKLFVIDTVITGSGNTNIGGGIVVQPTGASGSASVTLRRVQAVNNTNNGLFVNSTGNTGSGIAVAVYDSQFDQNSGAGIGVTNPASTTSVKVMVRNSTMQGNAIGVVTTGANAVVRVGGSAIANNSSFGVLAVGAGAGLGILSYTPASNQLNGNANDGSFSGTVALQ